MCGVLAVHVDNLAFAGTAGFFSQVMYLLRQNEKYPFKHWTVKSGDFLGWKLHQMPDHSIRIEQKENAEQLECISVSRDRRKQKETQVTADERRRMRGALGEIIGRWPAAKAQVKDLTDVDKAIARGTEVVVKEACRPRRMSFGRRMGTSVGAPLEVVQAGQTGGFHAGGRTSGVVKGNGGDKVGPGNAV